MVMSFVKFAILATLGEITSAQSVKQDLHGNLGVLG